MLRPTIIHLPDSIPPGSIEAVKAFGEEIARLKERYPEANFQLLPFSYHKYPGSKDSHITAIMAVNL